ncbi:MAG TPA: WD40 repeat domain-containing protein [Pirellulaceae bacterium]|nr:WD40 repeat domain-containing protein [Pirellulaceae bacterium]
MLLVALILTLVWILSWQWDPDERIVAAVWLLSAPFCVVAGWQGRRRGYVAAAAIGGVIPVTVYMISHYLRILGLGAWPEPLMLLTLLSISAAGAIGAVLLTTAIRQIRSLGPITRHRLIVAVVGLIVAGVVCRIAWVVYRDRTSWKPALTIAEFKSDLPNRPFALSDDGSVLAVAASGGPKGKARLRLWDVASGKERQSLDLNGAFVQSICLAPDGSRIAVVHGAKEGVSVYETTTGNLLKSLTAAPSNLRSGDNCCFSGDGRELAALEYNYRAQVYTVKMWATDTWESLGEHRVEGDLVRLFAAGDGLALLIGDGRARLLDAQSLKPLIPHAIDFDTVGQPTMSRDGMTVGSGHSLVDTQSGKVTRLTGPVYCLASGGRRFVARRCDMDAYRPRALDWRRGLPFVRHWWAYRTAGSQVVLVDAYSGKEICVSPANPGGVVGQIRCSGDGKMVAAQNWNGESFSVWRVPD